jgi:uncharacterized protein YkwD
MKPVLATLTLLTTLLPLPAQDKKDDPKPEQAVLTAINQERAKQKRAALRQNELLMKAARQHAEGLAKQNDVNKAADGKATLDRLKALGYRFSAMGENTGYGHERPEDVVTTWMGSNLHRDNLLSSRFTQVGLGAAKSADGTWFYVAIFASPGRR